MVGALGSLVAVPFVGIWLLNDPTGNASYQAAGLFFVPMLLIYFGPSVVAGLALLFGARWARVMLVWQAVAYLVLVPIGTALGAATLVVLAPGLFKDKLGGPRLSLPPFRELPRRASGLAAVALVGAGFVIGLNLLFAYHATSVPEPLGQLFYPAIPVFVLAGAVIVLSIWLSGGRPTASLFGHDPFGTNARRWARQTRDSQPDWRARVRRLEASPATRKYADRIRAGQLWSDEQIAYDMDPTQSASCVHLQPIEAAMRAAGILVRVRGFGYLDADCCVDENALAARFALQPPLRYYTMPGDRQYDPQSAVINCREHSVSIVVVHPEEARSDTPWFPVKP